MAKKYIVDLTESDLKPWQRQQWCILGVNAEFVWRMGDVLDLYTKLYDPACPLVCFDESPYQLVAETRAGLCLLHESFGGCALPGC